MHHRDEQAGAHVDGHADVRGVRHDHASAVVARGEEQRVALAQAGERLDEELRHADELPRASRELACQLACLVEGNLDRGERGGDGAVRLGDDLGHGLLRPRQDLPRRRRRRAGQRLDVLEAHDALADRAQLLERYLELLRTGSCRVGQHEVARRRRGRRARLERGVRGGRDECLAVGLGGEHPGDHVTRAAFSGHGDELMDDPVVLAVQLDGRLGGLRLGDRVARPHDVAVVHHPAEQGVGAVVGVELGHDDFRHRGGPF